MPRIHFAKSRPPLDVPEGSILMECLLEAGIPVASSCGGEGVCSKCKIQILKGQDHLSPENEVEKFLKETQGISKDFRISCQVKVFGDLWIDTSYW